MPFAEIPSLRNMVLTGEDDGDMSYMKTIQSPYAKGLPGSSTKALPPPGDDAPSGSKSGFRPVYD